MHASSRGGSPNFKVIMQDLKDEAKLWCRAGLKASVASAIDEHV